MWARDVHPGVRCGELQLGGRHYQSEEGADWLINLFLVIRHFSHYFCLASSFPDCVLPFDKAAFTKLFNKAAASSEH